MIVFDSCIWIALINENDSQHQKAVNLIESVNIDQILIYDYIYAEILTVLRLKVDEEACQKFVNMLDFLDIAVIISSQEDFYKTNEIFFRQDNKLSFVDCFLIALNSQNQVITFDHDLEKELV